MEVFESLSTLFGDTNNATDLITPGSESFMLTQGWDSSNVVNPLENIVLSTSLAGNDPFIAELE